MFSSLHFLDIALSLNIPSKVSLDFSVSEVWLAGGVLSIVSLAMIAIGVHGTVTALLLFCLHKEMVVALEM